MPEWLKISFGVLLMAAFFAAVSVFAYRQSRLVCVRWQPTPCSTVCVETERKCSTSYDFFEGKTKRRCHTECVRSLPCRECVKRLDRDDPEVPAEMEIPEDTCPRVLEREQR